MGTTALVVELLVVGTGTGTWLTLLTLTFFGYAWVTNVPTGDPLVLLVALPVVYVLGMVMDRLANAIFARAGIRLRGKSFATKEDFQMARQKASETSGVWAMFEYGRTRMRVARGWAVNSVLIAILGLAFVWIRLPDSLPRCKISFLGSALLLGLAAGCVYAWTDLVKSEFEALRTLQRSSRTES